MDCYEKLTALGIALPKLPPKAGLYQQAKGFGDKLVYVSGCGPDLNGVLFEKGKVGGAISFEVSVQAARNCILNVLSVLEENLGDLNRIKSFVKLTVFVASAPDFLQQPLTANAASQLLIDLFGDEMGCASRSAIGVAVLPGDIPVEIEALVELY